MNSLRGTALATNEYLETGDYIANYGTFFIMQGDGNVCWYNGSGPSDNQGLLWSASEPHGDGDYFLIMQSDGNLCAYRGTGPSDNQGVVFATNTSGATGDYAFSIYAMAGYPDLNTYLAITDSGSAIWNNPGFIPTPC
jgi:hypothetical protein